MITEMANTNNHHVNSQVQRRSLGLTNVMFMDGSTETVSWLLHGPCLPTYTLTSSCITCDTKYMYFKCHCDCAQPRAILPQLHHRVDNGVLLASQAQPLVVTLEDRCPHCRKAGLSASSLPGLVLADPQDVITV